MIPIITVTTSPTSSPTFKLSARLDAVGFSDIVQIRNKIMDLRAEGGTVHQFEGGEPYLPTPDHVKQAMDRALRENKTRYAPSSGIPELRAAISRKVRERNSIPAQMEDVIVVNGGMHGLFGSFQSVLNPGDEVLMFSPYWTPIKDLVAFSQATPVFVSTRQARSEGIEKALSDHFTSRTRAIYYNSPQNPTGMVFTLAEAKAVAQFARERDLIVVADEAYEDLVYDGDHVSIASLDDMFDRTITCFTLSKSYAMTGWRVGYVIAREPWMTGLRKTTLYSTNGVSTPSQWASLAAIETTADFFSKIRSGYCERRDLMIKGLKEIGFTCETPAGAFYAFPHVIRISHDSRVAASRLLDVAHVATVPGIIFGPHGEGHLRFSFSTALETIEAGLDSMRRNL